MWDDLQPLFQKAVDSFVLLPPSSNYIPPDKVSNKSAISKG
jgi:hypothetical protein